ncbi:MAG: U32 family peptidase [Bacilli bacterium]|nr:U32 family peptidase [Bacilli bacterium]
MIELLAPAGNLEKLKIAILYGADAVYFGGKKFSLRARASNFELDDIKEGVLFAHQHHAKVYVTMNIVPHDEDFEGLVSYLKALEATGVDGIIVTSPHIAKTALSVAPKLELHLSTQFSASNSATLNYFKKQGFSRAVLAREVSLSQLALIKKNCDLDLEVFIHGGMCSSYSGRCMLSNHLTNRDANRGGCAHSCRWNYTLYKDGKRLTDEYFQMGSKDLLGLRAIPELIELGIKSLKIEGRMKSVYYIATVVRVYRRLIDEYLKNKSISDYQIYEDEIYKAENRATATGFLYGKPKANEQVYDNTATPTNEFLGIVLDYDYQTQMVTAEQRNYFSVGTKVEFFGPSLNNTNHTIEEMYDDNFEKLEIARHARQIIKFKVPFPLEAYAMFRKSGNL